MKKILLIEDDADLFSLIQYNMEKEGFQFAGSQTGKGAVELCRREKPDLVILDIMLPDSDGLDICKRIRAHPELSHLPIIFLTARASETDRIVGLELGAKAVPDGYTLVQCNVGSNAIAMSLNAKMPYDPDRELAPVCEGTTIPTGMTVATSSGIAASSSAKSWAAWRRRKRRVTAMLSAMASEA